MSVYAMKPLFTDREGYLRWRKEWKIVYLELSKQIRTDKRTLASLQRQEDPSVYKNIQKELVHKRVMAHKLMTILEEAKLRRDRILGMHKQLAEQNAQFPLILEDCRNIDFHFNKVSIEFSFMPMWTLKAKGSSYHVNHIDANIPWTTRELPDGATRGMIRLKNGDITIDKDGNATINPKAATMLKVA